MSKLLGWIDKSDPKLKNKPAVVYRVNEAYESITYNELYAYVLALSDFLKSYKGGTIAIIGSNKLEYVAALLATICNLGDAFLIDKELKQADVEALFSIRKPDLIILDSGLDLAFSVPTLSFEDIGREMKSGRHFEVDERFAGKLILHTSGSTGRPKCLALEENQYLYIIKDLNKNWEVNESHSCLFIIPLYHIYALTSLFHGLYAGTANILEYEYSRLGDAFKKTNPSIFPGVPVIFNRIKDAAYEKGGWKLDFAIGLSKLLLLFGIDIRKKLFAEIHAYFGNSYYFSVCGGSIFDPKTNRFFNDIGLPVYNGYGMTETSGPIAICYRKNNDFTSVGKVLNNQIRIINPDEKGIGEICISGPNIFTGYIGENNEADLADGYFNTGDLGYMKNGFLYITGRKKKVLIGDNGKNIPVQELVDKVLKNQEIYDCTITLNQNKIVAILDTTLPKDEVEKYVNQVNAGLPHYKKISDFKIVDKGFRDGNS